VDAAGPVGARAAKDDLNRQFAALGQALSNAHRVEMLDLLAQGERSVELLAARARITIKLASAHLQVLRRAGLVVARREGIRVVYRLAGDDVVGLLSVIRSVATARIAEAERAARVFATGSSEVLGRDALLERLRLGQAVVVDLRPPEEYAAGHVSGALSIPLEELRARLSELPDDVEVVAYCRGPFCALAPIGVGLLRAAGLRARRLEDGFPEWRLAGLPVVRGTLPA
jgi:rhodanese-related sulfurtransferase